MSKRRKIANNSIDLLSEGFIIGGVSLLGYLCAYLYEYSYLDYFKIPREFVSLNLTNIFIAIGSITGTFFALLTILNLFSVLGLLDAPTELRRRVRFSLVLLIYLLFKIAVYKSQWKEWFATASLLIVFVLFDFAWPALVYRKEKTLEDKIRANDLAEKKRNLETIYDKIIRSIYYKFGPLFLQLLIFVIVILFIAFDAGKMNAFQRKTFPIIAVNNKSFAVIRIYEERLLAKPLDKENKKLINKLFLFRIDDLSKQNLYLEFEDIGPLKVD